MGRWLVLLVLGTLLGAALVAPAVHEVAGHWLPAARWPFARVFDRLAVAFAAVLVVALRRHLGLGLLGEVWRSEGWRAWLRRVPVAFATAAVPAMAVFPLVVADTPVGWAGRSWLIALWVLTAAIPGAVLVSALEESFFRVLVFCNLARRLPIALAVAASSVLYGSVHFLTPDRSFTIASASPLEGLRYLGAVLARLLAPPVLKAAAGLALMGAVLCVVLWRTGSLALCVGLHAGWFAATKAAVYLSTLEPGAPAAGSLGKRLLLLGSPWVWLAVVLAAVLVLVVRSPGRKSRDES